MGAHNGRLSLGAIAARAPEGLGAAATWPLGGVLGRRREGDPKQGGHPSGKNPDQVSPADGSWGPLAPSRVHVYPYAYYAYLTLC